MTTLLSDTESPNDTSQTVVSSKAIPSLKGPTIFVYVISTLAGLAAGGLIASFCGRTIPYILNWPENVGSIALRSGPLGGLVVAWFWTKIMAWHVRNYKSPKRIALYGILWGVVAGWVATAILWGFECMFFAGIEGLTPQININMAFGCMVYFGSIGGLGAGLICGVAWAIWTRPGK